MDNNTEDSLPSEPRENMIATAVKFLQNPKVAQSPIGQKKTFLEKKGLTKEEIDIAIARSGITDSVQGVGQTGVVAVQPGVYPPGVQTLAVQPTVPVSGWSKFKDYTATLIVVGGVSYAVYKLYKKYVVPVWYGPTAEERHLTAIQKSITELQASIQETLQSIKEMQTSITSQQKHIEDLSGNDGPRRDQTNSIFVNEVKDEIKSLKGLLLSRKQFPPTPITQPVLPAWQLAASKSDEKNVTPEVTVGTSNNDTAPSGSSDVMVGNNDPAPSGSSDVTLGNNDTAPSGGSEDTLSAKESEEQNTDPQEDKRGHGSTTEKDEDTPVLANGHLANGDQDSSEHNDYQSSSSSITAPDTELDETAEIQSTKTKILQEPKQTEQITAS